MGLFAFLAGLGKLHPWLSPLKKLSGRPTSLAGRLLDASALVFLCVFLLGLLMNWLEPFGLDNASKAQSQRITARVLAPFYGSDAQDHVAVVMIDDHTLAARGVGWPPQYTYYDELLRRILAQRPRAVYLDILMQQRRDYDDSYEDARLGIGEEIAAAGIPVYFGVAAPGGRSIFSGAGGARDVVTSWQGAGSDYPLSIRGDYINAQGAAMRTDAGGTGGADACSVALALYDAACAERGTGCSAPASALSAQARAQPMVVRWGSTLPQSSSGNGACTRTGDVALGTRLAASARLLWDSFNSGRDEQVEDRHRAQCAYTFTVFEEQLDDEAMRDALTDRVVLVGTHLTGLNDRVLSPVHQQIPGVYLHAMALDNLMTWGERRTHRTEGANNRLALLNAVLLSLAAGIVLVTVRGTIKRLVLMAALSVLLGLGVAVFAQVVLHQPPQDWIGLLGLALAVTWYVANLGPQGPDKWEQGDGQGESEDAPGVGAAGGTGGGDSDSVGGERRHAAEGEGDPGHQ
ncbi:CHASE2 domain-containing protein [Pseudoxanthomonas sp. LjRoot143]|uniref:CHASE2 domain-containing protein n=1 Tax=Pseudoxanthomonas sp. LjRoot143 TaxID=3342266 RepID=UPI003ECF79A6